MKKVLVICLSLVMLVSMSLTVFAAPGSFVSSPSGNPAPKLDSFTPGSSDCSATLVITPYSDRDTLPSDQKDNIENAYSSIASTDDLTTLNDDLKKLVSDKKLNGKKLAVSDLFNAHVEGCTIHDDHVGSEIVISAESLNRFVALIHKNENGDWELVPNVEVVNDGKSLKFSTDSFGTFAIVVNTEVDNPRTGDATMTYICAVVMALCALALVAVVIKGRKQKA